MIESHFATFQAINALSPIVTVDLNFDELGFAPDHPGRSLTDSYYFNKKHMLRTHTSAHEVSTFRQGSERWLLTADVYRRDEIDASHYPVFHQMEGAHVVPRSQAIEVFEASNAILEKKLTKANIIITDDTRIHEQNPYQAEHDPIQAEIVARNLKNSLNSLVLELFGGIANRQGSGEPLRVRWIEAFFPFTSPSYEVEVLFDGKWLEILGCGVVRQKTLDTAGPLLPSPSHI
jgi:phenylalanyl-tRNA synthetase alpha chain